VTARVARDPTRPPALLAVTGGVASPNDGIKAILAGADAAQRVSAILRHGLSYFTLMREELRRWMESLEFARVADLRGRLSLATTQADGGRAQVSSLPDVTHA
jgi:dihydroorotate dehydrogenase